ncbi:MAG TPA: cysteine--tRNA ligase [Thermomicrobiales bacterium]|nr:cysteine--tRNA ligase [Thermomicrobiales bacterium]
MRLFNTQTQAIEPVVAPDGHVGIYVCGVTPYDTTHMGHAFTFLTYDILTRILRDLGHRVTYVQNVTDIDDDILRKSRELGLEWDELARRETAKYRADMRNLNALEFDHYVAATDHIAEMQDLIASLIEKDLAYVSNGSVYFSVERDPGFGKLSHLAPDEWLPIANERGNVPDDPNKRAPIDFIMWQAASPGEPTWDSPWGPGRPGWHIECSAMSMKYLGQTIDIHGGGGDLVFPHHECEIAQSEHATGITPFVRTWMHVAMVEYQGEKMSKSLGNLVLASTLLETYSADAIRLYLFSHHYRAPWEFLDDEMETWASIAGDLAEAVEFPAYGVDDVLDVSRQGERCLDALQDDFDTPTAIEELREIARLILEAPEEDDIREAQATLRHLGSLMGLTLST